MTTTPSLIPDWVQAFLVENVQKAGKESNKLFQSDYSQQANCALITKFWWSRMKTTLTLSIVEAYQGLDASPPIFLPSLTGLKRWLWRHLTALIAIGCSKDDRIERCQALAKTANSLPDALQSIASHGSCCCIREGRFEVAPLSWISANRITFLAVFGFWCILVRMPNSRIEG